MLSWTLSNEQEKMMYDWIAAHNKDKQCPIFKRQKKIEALKARGKANPYSTGGGGTQYSVEIHLTAVGDLAAVRCTECGKDLYLGEV